MRFGLYSFLLEHSGIYQLYHLNVAVSTTRLVNLKLKNIFKKILADHISAIGCKIMAFIAEPIHYFNTNIAIWKRLFIYLCVFVYKSYFSGPIFSIFFVLIFSIAQIVMASQVHYVDEREEIFCKELLKLLMRCTSMCTSYVYYIFVSEISWKSNRWSNIELALFFSPQLLLAFVFCIHLNVK